MNPMKIFLFFLFLSRWTGNGLQYQWYLFIYDSSSACYYCLVHKSSWLLLKFILPLNNARECAYWIWMWFSSPDFYFLLSRVWKLKIKAFHTWIQNKCRGYELHEISQIMKNHKNFFLFFFFFFLFVFVSTEFTEKLLINFNCFCCFYIIFIFIFFCLAS